ncbi:hypothetical protein [Eubacterium callanderi]|uniref:hypothetical protein n=1 Tax=Eubacterium callanderi TaxID=53442 RepID=UPI001AA16C56|nr:hypothetical protein [Eubacterium callanderi]MBO1702213.1 hypothetical protein [Eubacterium callanderi]
MISINSVEVSPNSVNARAQITIKVSTASYLTWADAEKCTWQQLESETWNEVEGTA